MRTNLIIVVLAMVFTMLFISNSAFAKKGIIIEQNNVSYRSIVDGSWVQMVVVKKNNSFWSIAKKYHVSWTELKRINKDKLRHSGNFDLIYPDQVFQLPVKKSDVKKVSNINSGQKVKLPDVGITKSDTVPEKVLSPAELEQSAVDSCKKLIAKSEGVKVEEKVVETKKVSAAKTDVPVAVEKTVTPQTSENKLPETSPANTAVKVREDIPPPPVSGDKPPGEKTEVSPPPTQSVSVKDITPEKAKPEPTALAKDTNIPPLTLESIAKSASVEASKSEVEKQFCSPQKSDDLLKFEGSVSYTYGCLDFIGKCNIYGGNVEVYVNSQAENTIGFDFGASAIHRNLKDVDSDLVSNRYFGQIGLIYKHQSGKKRFTFKNGLMYQYTEDQTLSLGFDKIVPDLVIPGIEMSTVKMSLLRTQNTILYYNKTDFVYNGEKWRIMIGAEVRLPISQKVSTNSEAYLSRYDETLAVLSFGIQRKISDDLFFGIKTLPVFWSGEMKMLGAKTSLSLDWKKISLEGGVLMHPYGLSPIARQRGGTFSDTLNAFFSLGVKF